MGCDIHSIGQVLKDGIWVTKVARPGGDDRDYDSFAVLADVRNGSGFAGVTTGAGWPVIAEPRGLPDDLLRTGDLVVPTPLWQYKFQDGTSDWEHDLWLGDHSHSWLLLSEIEAFIETSLQGRASGHTLKSYVEELRKLATSEGVPTDQVRLVFGFDS